MFLKYKADFVVLSYILWPRHVTVKFLYSQYFSIRWKRGRPRQGARRAWQVRSTPGPPAHCSDRKSPVSLRFLFSLFQSIYLKWTFMNRYHTI